MVIQEAAEMYLETILVVEHRQGNVRSVDIANEMGYSKPTISEQMKKFRANGYVETDENGFLRLTPSGREIAERIYERHEVLAKALMKLGVSRATAYADACKIEHDVSEETFQTIKAHLTKNELENK